MYTRRPCCLCQSGLTVLEALLSLSILAIVMYIFTASVVGMYRVNSLSERRMQGIHYTRSIIERIQTIPLSDLRDNYSFVEPEAGGFSSYVLVEPGGGGGKLVTVQTRWYEQGTARLVELRRLRSW